MHFASLKKAYKKNRNYCTDLVESMEVRVYLLETIFRIILQSFDETRQHFRCENVMIALVSGECAFYLRHET